MRCIGTCRLGSRYRPLLRRVRRLLPAQRKYSRGRGDSSWFGHSNSCRCSGLASMGRARRNGMRQAWDRCGLASERSGVRTRLLGQRPSHPVVLGATAPWVFLGWQEGVRALRLGPVPPAPLPRRVLAAIEVTRVFQIFYIRRGCWQISPSIAYMLFLCRNT